MPCGAATLRYRYRLTQLESVSADLNSTQFRFLPPGALSHAAAPSDGRSVQAVHVERKAKDECRAEVSRVASGSGVVDESPATCVTVDAPKSPAAKSTSAAKTEKISSQPNEAVEAAAADTGKAGQGHDGSDGHSVVAEAPKSKAQQKAERRAIQVGKFYYRFCM